MAAEIMAAYLKGAPAPVTIKKLQKDFRSRHGWSAEQVTSFLTDAVRSGAVSPWPRYRNSSRYWDRDPSEVVRQQVLDIAGEIGLSKKDLLAQSARRAHNCGRKCAEEAIGALVKSGDLQSAKPVGPTALYYRNGRPGALIAGCLATLGERLRTLGIDEPIAFDEGASAKAGHAPASESVLDAIARLQPAPGVPVTVQSLRAALPAASKQAFDDAVLSLADQQKIYLTTHDHGWALAETEREQLVWDGGQKLYVAVTLRD